MRPQNMAHDTGNRIQTKSPLTQNKKHIINKIVS